jgi:hypothetical protein
MFNINFLTPQLKAEKRRFHRLISGLTIGINKDERMRFMTLTTAKNVSNNINNSFDVLKMRILREFHWTFNKYFKVKTAEGNGVLHIVYRGQFIPQKWLSQQWVDIHHSPIVDIREIHWKNGVIPLTNYLITNYLCGKGQKVERMSYGWGWLWKGALKSYKNILSSYNLMRVGTTITQPKGALWVKFVDRYRNHGLEAWKSKLKVPNQSSKQSKITKYF